MPPPSPSPFRTEPPDVSAASTQEGVALAAVGDRRELPAFTVRSADKIFLADKTLPISGDHLLSAPVAGRVGLWKDGTVVGSVSDDATLGGDLTCSTVER